MSEFSYSDNGRIVVRNDVIERPDPALFNPQGYDSWQAVSRGGRQAAWFVEASFGHGVLRHYRRGGLVARFSEDRYIWRGVRATRSFAEFFLLNAMAAEGLPVPRAWAACYERRRFTYTAAILVERLRDTQTLAALVLRQGKNIDAEQVNAVANAIRQLHDANVWHADLNADNILLDKQGKAWLIDFDKAKRTSVLGSQRQDNLQRLQRSLRKIAPNAGDHWGVAIAAAYVR